MDIFEIFKKIGTNDRPHGKITHIIVGLGNPGIVYENTRHNAGFAAIDKIAANCGIKFTKMKWNSYIAEADLGGVRVMLVKPLTFMNISGDAVDEVMQFYKIPPERTLILCDEIYAEPGNIRIRRKGSHGGHNGLRSIFTVTDSDEFPRIKIGVGQKPEGRNLAEWVLSKITPEEEEAFGKAIENTAAAAELIVGGGIDEAMNRYSS
ncbi:MAG: aminoacyl-tRNA hydrolase [Ruminococcus sp.]|jgi:PTH1 family peptidyl-tRNA hydrolase|nr:aminoacyl-tRNA hydrolase [Ruminococcus sp.]